MGLKFGPLLQSLPLLTKRVTFRGIITTYGSEIQTTVANPTITNWKGQFWSKNNHICVWNSDHVSCTYHQRRYFCRNNNEMCPKFRPLLPTLQLLTKSVNFGIIITRYGSEIQTTIADFTITNQKGQFWSKNNHICVWNSDHVSCTYRQKRYFCRNNNEMCLKFRPLLPTLQLLTKSVNLGE